MQKKIIALAVAAMASGAAFAQTNVQIYGVVDLGQAWVKSSGETNQAGNADQKTVGRLDSNSSYIGFRGTEDLGNGLKALFQYETGFDASTAGGLNGGRDTYVGLTGGFGTLVMGNLTHPLRAMGAKVELLPGAAGFGSMASVTGTINVPGLGEAQTGADNRAQNAIAYVSPSFSGLTATVAYVNGERRRDTAQNAATLTGEAENGKQYQFALQYAQGPLWVAAGYHKTIDLAAAVDTNGAAPNGLLGGDVDARVWRLAATYDFPTNTKLTALYDNTRVDGPNNVPTADAKRSAWSVGVAQGFGANTVGLEYGRRGQTNVNGVDPKDAAKIWTAMYSYSLSKRTQVHARYSKLTNESAAQANFYLNNVNNNLTGAAGSDYTGYMVGLRHSF
jgi:predicted porin